MIVEEDLAWFARLLPALLETPILLLLVVVPVQVGTEVVLVYSQTSRLFVQSASALAVLPKMLFQLIQEGLEYVLTA